MTFKFVAPCYFGLESAAAFDFKRLGAQNLTVSDGRLYFEGDETLLAEANLWSRCTERIMILLASFDASTFDQLFDGVFDIPWEDYIPKNGKFPVKGASLSSTLSSVPACQSIVKKAVVDRLRKGHQVQFLPERGDEYRIRFSLRKDKAEIFLDTSGEGLHKRGYRRTAGLAPLKETLAAAIADFSRVRRDTTVEDPFCGSGTLIIEAALKARNIAPGLNRSFAAEHYGFISPSTFSNAREKARSEALPDAPFRGMGRDIDPSVIAVAMANAETAGVGDCCQFKAGDVGDYVANPEAVMLANPPYGERLMDETSAAVLMRVLGRQYRRQAPKSAYIITSDVQFEEHFGEKAKKRRKLYNGMIPCQLYMYF